MRGKHIIGSVMAGVLMCATVISAGAACVGVGTVDGDGLRLRKEAGVEAGVLATANKGATVVVLEEKDGWYKVDFETQVGYMSAAYVQVETSVEKDLGWAMVTTEGDPLNLRSGAGTSFDVLCKLSNGTAVKVLGLVDGWYKVGYGDKTGYVSSDYITLTQDENGTRKDGDVKVAETAGAPSAVAATIVANAKAQLGKPYVWGAAGPKGFDCSGFTNYVAKISGFNIPRGATSQWKGNPGTYIKNYNDLQPGDFIYICNPAYANGYPISHALIYLGNNQVIHADSTKRCIATKSFENYKKYFKGAWRLG